MEPSETDNATLARTLLDVHQERVSNGIDITDHTLQIVSVLGGIDEILAHYLTATTTKQLPPGMNNITNEQTSEKALSRNDSR